MSSNNVGVQAKVRQDGADLAAYTHCASHCLNLVISRSCSLPMVRNMIDKLKEACLMFNNSHKKESLLQEVINKDEPDTEKKKPLLDLCTPRWEERQSAYEHFHEFYKHILTTLEIIAHGLHHDQGYQENLLGPWGPDSKHRASALLHALTDFTFIVTFSTVYRALSNLHGITVKLQARTRDIVDAYNMVSTTWAFYM